MIVDQRTNNVVAGIGDLGRPEFTMDDVERYLEGER